MKIEFINCIRYKLHQLAKMKNNYLDERNLHNLKDSMIHQFDENKYLSIGCKFN